MRKMSTMLALFLTLLMILSLTACAKHVHAFGEWEVKKEATCTEAGEQTRKCECGETETETIPATGHKFGEWETKKEATCTDAGERIRKCDCGETETETISAAGHQFGDWTAVKEATCTEDGEESRTCSVCGETETQVVKAPGHSFTAATLFTPKTCTVCGETEGEALGHVIGIGEEQSGDDYKFTLKDVFFTKQISESVGNVTYKSNEGNYLVLKMSFTNLATEKMERYHSNRVSEMQLKYDDKFDYEGEFRILTDDIVPLDTRNAYIMYTIPEQVGKEKDTSVYAAFKVDQDTYVVEVRKGEKKSSDDSGDGKQANTTEELAKKDVRTDGENFSFVLEDIFFSKKVSESVGNVTHSTQEGNYLVLKLSFTNLANEKLDKYHSTRISDIKCTFDDKYVYDGDFRVLVDDIVPLDTKNAYIMYSVPETVGPSSGTLVATFTIDGCTFTVDCRK